MRMLGRAQQRQADHRRKQAGDHPGGQQRQGHHGEQREGVFAGIAAGEAHGQEPRDGDQRSGEPRIGGGGIGEDSGLLLVVAAFQAEDHALDGDHRVVHQQAERDDQGAERDALKVDAERLHRPEYDSQHQRNRDDDDGARAQAEAHHAHREDDGDRLPQRFHEFIDRMADRLRLVRHHDRFDADRQVGLQLLHGLLDVAAEREHVAAVAHGNRQAQAGLAVDAEDRVRRVGVLPPTSAMSASRRIRSPTAKLTARMSFSDISAPLTRNLIVSSSVVMSPDGTTMFCACSAAIRVAGVRPYPASFAGENWM